jgi:amidase
MRSLALALVLLLAPVFVANAARERDCLRTLAGIDLQRATVLDLQAAMARGRITSADLVRASHARIDAFDHGRMDLNSIRALHPGALRRARALDRRRARGKVRGPLHGIPVLLKDNIGTKDLPTTAGSFALRGSVPLHDATVTARLRRAGAVILGKTNLSEFANWVSLSMPSGYSSLAGQVVNAHHGGDPSGSSSGSGVAASMAFATVTLGTETSGSIISPSFANGLVGVKPSMGVASRFGILPLAPSFDVPGPMTRTVTDAAAALDAIAGPDARDPVTLEARRPVRGYLRALRANALRGARIGVPSPDQRPSGTIGELFARALDDLERAGATLVDTDELTGTRFAGLSEIALIPNEFKWSLNEYLARETVPTLRVRTLTDIVEFNRQHPERMPYGQRLLEASDATPGNGALATATAPATIASARAAIDAVFLAHDLDAIVDLNSTNVNVGAAAGYPSVTVPAGMLTTQRPAGITFLGPVFSDASLLAYAYAYERVSRRRVPPTEVNTALFPIRCR